MLKCKHRYIVKDKLMQFKKSNNNYTFDSDYFRDIIVIIISKDNYSLRIQK